MRVSVSQLKTSLRCGREWVFRYVLKYPDKPSDAIKIGRVFHKLCEGDSLSFSHISSLEDRPWGAYFRRMLAAHALERRKYAPNFLREQTYEKDGDIKMIVDEIARNDKGEWWIVENKSSTNALGLKAKMLASDLQIGLYSAYRKDYATEWWLDPDKYQGCVYIVTTKPAERRKTFKRGGFSVPETLEAWGERMTSSAESVLVDQVDEKGAIATRDFGRKCIDYYLRVYDKYQDWRPIPIRSESCMRYGKPCPYFSFCHGR